MWQLRFSADDKASANLVQLSYELPLYCVLLLSKPLVLVSFWQSIFMIKTALVRQHPWEQYQLGAPFSTSHLLLKFISPLVWVCPILIRHSILHFRSDSSPAARTAPPRLDLRATPWHGGYHRDSCVISNALHNHWQQRQDQRVYCEYFNINVHYIVNMPSVHCCIFFLTNNSETFYGSN